MYYYLELLQQRRICNAATNNDGRSQTMVDLHEVSVRGFLLLVEDDDDGVRTTCCSTPLEYILVHSNSMHSTAFYCLLLPSTAFYWFLTPTLGRSCSG